MKTALANTPRRAQWTCPSTAAQRHHSRNCIRAETETTARSTSSTNKTAGDLHKGRDDAKIRVDKFFTQWLFASSSRALPCFGDSGGPALRWVDDYEAVVGLISNSDGAADGRCNDSDEAQYYTRLSSKVDWLEDTLDIECTRRTKGGTGFLDCQDL